MAGNRPLPTGRHAVIPGGADQALRAMVWLGAQQGVPRTREEIAAGCGIPMGCLVRLLARLTRARLVAARRGRHGGYALGRPAAAINLHEVVVAVDPSAAGRLGRSDPAPATGLDLTLAQARRREDDLLRRTSIARVLGRRSRGSAAGRLQACPPHH